MILTSSSMVTEIRTRATLSSNQLGLSDAQILTQATLEITEYALPMLTGLADEYLIYEDSFQLVPNQAAYRMPYRAVGTNIRDIYMVNGDGSTSNLSYFRPEDAQRYRSSRPAPPQGFYVRGNYLVFMPTPSQAATIVLSYPFRPNDLVPEISTTTISSINPAMTVLTLASTPLNFVNLANYDIVNQLSGNEILHFDQQGTLGVNTLTFANPMTNAAVGNYVSLSRQASVPMIPEEMHAYVLEATVLRIEVLRGNKDRYASMDKALAGQREGMKSILEGRIKSKAQLMGGSTNYRGYIR